MIIADSLIALASALTTAVYFIYTSRVMKRNREISSTLTLTVGHLAAALCMAPLWLVLSSSSQAMLVSPAVYTPFLITGGLLVLSRQLYFYAYARTDVANITVFSALTPVYALATGFVLLGEVPKPLPLLGMALICGSIYALFLKRDLALPLISNIIQPFRAIGSSPPVLCAFLSTIPTAFAAAFQKQLLFTVDPVTFTFVLLTLIGLLALAMCFYLFSFDEIVRQVRMLPLGFIGASIIMLPLMHVLFCLVIREHQTSMSLVLQRISILFQIVLAYIFLHERQDMPKRTLVGLCIVAGFVMIMSAS